MLRRVGAAALVPVLASSGQCRWTTILSVRKGKQVVLMGDKQVTLGERVVAKATAKKLRRAGEDVMVGFAGSTADAISLLEKLEAKLQEYPNQLLRAAVELAKDWRSDKVLRRLEASLIVCDKSETLEIDGQGNVITPEDDGIAAIGSGGMYAKAAARALIDLEGWTAEAIAEKAIRIATAIDVFSNSSFDKDVINIVDTKPPTTDAAPTATPAATTQQAAPPTPPAKTQQAAEARSKTEDDDDDDDEKKKPSE